MGICAFAGYHRDRMSHMTSNGVRTLLVVVTALVVGASSLGAQQPDPSSASLKRIRAALQSPPVTGSDGVSVSAPEGPDEVRWGVFTFLSPDTPGQFVSVSLPVGALAGRAFHSIAAARRRRAENAARAEVAKALAEFRAAPRK